MLLLVKCVLALMTIRGVSNPGASGQSIGSRAISLLCVHHHVLFVFCQLEPLAGKGETPRLEFTFLVAIKVLIQGYQTTYLREIRVDPRPCPFASAGVHSAAFETGARQVRSRSRRGCERNASQKVRKRPNEHVFSASPLCVWLT